MNYTKESTMLQNFPCRCAILLTPDKSYSISYCAKHKAAPDMYEALKAILDGLTSNHKGKEQDLAIRASIFLCKRILAKVERR